MVVGFRNGVAADEVLSLAVEAVLVATTDADRAGLPRFQCVGDTAPGMSGSPVYLLSDDRERGTLVGMYSGRTPTGHAEFLGRDALAKTALAGVQPTHALLARTHVPDPQLEVVLPHRVSGPPMRISRRPGESSD